MAERFSKNTQSSTFDDLISKDNRIRIRDNFNTVCKRVALSMQITYGGPFLTDI